MAPPPPPPPPQAPRSTGRGLRGRRGPADQCTDDELMLRCGRGHTAALEELMGRHTGAAHRYAWRIFRDHHTAEDIVQEFFIKLFRNAARYQPRGHFTTYFYRVLANLCFDSLRKRKRRRKIQAVQLDPIEAEGTELEPLAHPDESDRRLRAHEAKDAVHAALVALPLHVREALELREFEGLRYREIAEVMDVSLNEVKVLLHRGRKLLARTLARTPVGREIRGEDPAPGGAL
ncbi:MAG: RNA polymerase sigma factor [Planctomycetota bacterium]|nr:RNA polymerase sigma factor [Planctomycetota bacterium]